MNHLSNYFSEQSYNLDQKEFWFQWFVLYVNAKYDPFNDDWIDTHSIKKHLQYSGYNYHLASRFGIVEPDKNGHLWRSQNFGYSNNERLSEIRAEIYYEFPAETDSCLVTKDLHIENICSLYQK